MTLPLALAAATLTWVVGIRLVLGSHGRHGFAHRSADGDAGGLGVRARRRLGRVFTPLCGFTVPEVEQAERQRLLDRPWEEEFLHWAHDGWRWRLHGHLPPPADGRRLGTTATGWCRAAHWGAGSGVPLRRRPHKTPQQFHRRPACCFGGDANR